MLKRAKKVVNQALERAGYELRRRRDTLTAVDQLLGARDVREVVDVGANKGDTVAAWRERFPHARIHAFEPFQGCVAQLNERFRGDPGVVTVPKAVGHEPGTLELKVSSGVSTHSLLGRPDDGRYGPRGVEEAGVQQVEVTTLDSWASEAGIEHIDLLKVDVEGFEKNVFDGAAGLLDAAKVDVVISEVMFVPLYDGQALCHEIVATLQDRGYDLYELLELRHHRDGQARWGNAVFVSRPFRAQALG